MNKKFKSIVASGFAVLSISGVSSLPVEAMQTYSIDEVDICRLRKEIDGATTLIEFKKIIWKLGIKIGFMLENYIIDNDELRIDKAGFSKVLNDMKNAESFKKIYEIVQNQNMDKNLDKINLDVEDKDIPKETKMKILSLARKKLISYLIDGLATLMNLATKDLSIKFYKVVRQGNNKILLKTNFLRDGFIDKCSDKVLKSFYFEFIDLTRNLESKFNLTNDVDKFENAENFCFEVQKIISYKYANIFSSTDTPEMKNNLLYKRVHDIDKITAFLLNNINDLFFE